jgi:hypothetical protein
VRNHVFDSSWTEQKEKMVWSEMGIHKAALEEEEDDMYPQLGIGEEKESHNHKNHLGKSNAKYGLLSLGLLDRYTNTQSHPSLEDTNSY